MIALIVICVALLVLGYELSRRALLSPVVLTCGIWLLGLILFLVMPHPLPPLTDKFLFCASLWIGLYCIAALFMQSFTYRVSQTDYSKVVFDIYFWISLCCVPLLIFFVYQALRFGDSGNWAMDLRRASLGYGRFESEGTYTPLYFTLWQVTYLLALFKADKKNWQRAVILGVLVLGFGVATMAKFVLLSLGVMTVVVLYERKIIRLRHIIAIGALLVLVMLVQHAIRQGVTYDKKSLFEVFELYILRNFTAFDTLKPCAAEHWGENVFRFFYAVSYKLGWGPIEPIDPMLPFIYKPTYTNTYTCMYPFFTDFGILGVGIGAIISGAFIGWIFKKKQLGSSYFTLLFAYFCTAIIIQYNSEFLFMNFSGHVKACLLLYIPFLVNQKLSNG